MRAQLLDGCVEYPASGRGVPVAEMALHVALQGSWETMMQAGNGNVLLLPEQSLGGGIADLVVAEVDLSIWERRAVAGIEACTSQEQLLIVDTLRASGRPLTMPELEAALAERFRRRRDRATLTRALSIARRKGLVAPATARGIAEAASRWQPAVLQLAAVEAKMGRWAKAYSQARGWRHAVDYPWLAFPGGYAPRAAEALDEMAETSGDQVGVLGVTDAGRLVVHRASRPDPAPDPHRRLWAEEALYGRWRRERAVGR